MSLQTIGGCYVFLCEAFVVSLVAVAWECHPTPAQILNSWFPVEDAVWGGSGGTALLGEVCHWRWSGELQALVSFLFFFCFMLVYEDVTSRFSSLAAMSATEWGLTEVMWKSRRKPISIWADDSLIMQWRAVVCPWEGRRHTWSSGLVMQNITNGGNTSQIIPK